MAVHEEIKEMPASYGALDCDPSVSQDADDAIAEYALKKPLKKAQVSARQPHSLLGIFWILLGSFLFSCLFLLVKLLEDKADTFTVVFYRSLVQVCICIPLSIRNGENPIGPPGGTTRFWLLIRGGLGGGAVIAWFFGIQHLPLPDAVTIQFTTPVFAAAFALCLVGEPWTKLNMAGAVVCLSGVVLIAHPTWLFGHGAAEEEDEVGDDAAWMKVLAIAATTVGAAMAGLAYVSVRMIGCQCTANVMVFYFAALSMPLVFLGSKLFLGTWAVWGDESFTLWDCFLLFMTGITGYFGQYVTNLGLQLETAATATLATSTQIVWSYIFGLTLLHQGTNLWSTAGSGLILGFMMIVGHMKLREQPIPGDEMVAEELEASVMLFASVHASIHPSVHASERFNIRALARAAAREAEEEEKLQPQQA